MLNLMFLAATAMAGDLDAQPLMMVDGQIVVGPTVGELIQSQGIPEGQYFLGDLYQNWLNENMPEANGRDVSLGINVIYNREGLGGVYACSCPDSCDSEDCEYMVTAGFFPEVMCSGMCKERLSCDSDFQTPAAGNTNETETETSGQTNTEKNYSGCSLYSCEEEVMFPTNSSYHSWIMEMLSRQD